MLYPTAIAVSSRLWRSRRRGKLEQFSDAVIAVLAQQSSRSIAAANRSPPRLRVLVWAITDRIQEVSFGERSENRYQRRISSEKRRFVLTELQFHGRSMSTFKRFGVQHSLAYVALMPRARQYLQLHVFEKCINEKYVIETHRYIQVVSTVQGRSCSSATRVVQH